MNLSQLGREGSARQVESDSVDSANLGAVHVFVKTQPFIIAACLTLGGCLYFQFRVPEARAEKPRLNRALKIAAVGFHPYKMFHTGSRVLPNKQVVMDFEPVVDDKASMADRMPFARPVEEFEVTGVETLPENRGARFYDEFIGLAGESGHVTMAQLFVPGEMKRFKRRDVDYYLVGFLLPARPLEMTRKASQGAIIASVFTFFLIPLRMPMDEKVIVRVYDSDLRFVKEFRRESGYFRVNRWGPGGGTWQPPVNPAGGHPVYPQAFEADLQDIETETVQFFNALP